MRKTYPSHKQVGDRGTLTGATQIWVVSGFCFHPYFVSFPVVGSQGLMLWTSCMLRQWFFFWTLKIIMVHPGALSGVRKEEPVQSVASGGIAKDPAGEIRAQLFWGWITKSLSLVTMSLGQTVLLLFSTLL